MNNKRTAGYWVLMILGVLLLIMLLLGQTMSFIDYDFAVSLGLQESKDVIGETGAAMNKGFGVGDTMIYAPFLLIGLLGLGLRKTWGVFAMAGAMGITAYWPIVSLFMLIFARGTPGFNFTSFASYTVILLLVTIYGLWGFCYLCRKRSVLVKESL
jgi:hypothetical protein